SCVTNVTKLLTFLECYSSPTRMIPSIDSGTCPPKALPAIVVSAEVSPSVNTAHSRLLRRCGEACEVSRHSRQRLGADIESELVAEVKAQHGRARFTDCAVCSWVGRIWSGPRG